MSSTATDYRIYRLSKEEWIKYGAVGLLLAAVIAYVFYKSIYVFLVLSPLAYLYPLYKKKELAEKRNRRLLLEFRETILNLSSELSAGFSLENASRETESEIKLIYGESNFMVKELEHMNHLISMNIPIERAWDEFAKRTDTEDIRNFARVIRIAKRSGGELNSVISHSADTIGDKIRIQEEIRTLTSAKRLEQKIMNVIPLVIVIYIDVTSPGFFDVMYEGVMGRLIMTGCLGVYIAAIWISKKLLMIKI